MAQITILDTAEGSITTPDTGKTALFIDTNVLKMKTDAGLIIPVGTATAIDYLAGQAGFSVNHANATASNTVALGWNSWAQDTGNTVVGDSAYTASGTSSYSTVIGQGSQSYSQQSTVVGAQSNGYDFSVTLGSSANSWGANSVAIGYQSVASSNGAIAIGYSTHQWGNFGVAIGYGVSGTTAGAITTGTFLDASTWAPYASTVTGTLAATTTDATPVEMFLWDNLGVASTMGSLQPGLYTVNYTVQGTDGTDIYAATGVNTYIYPSAGAMTLSSGNLNISSPTCQTLSAATWYVGTQASIINANAIAFMVTGEAGKTIKWSGSFTMTTRVYE
jgi:hypothetical protein